MAKYTQLRWSTVLAENTSDLLTVVLYRYGIQRTFKTIMKYMKFKHWIRM